MSEMDRYPCVSYLEHRAQHRMPHFAWEFLASGTGEEALIARNLATMASVRLLPRALAGRIVPQAATEIFGRCYDVPFGAAPIGMAGLLWPGAEAAIADAARTHNFPTTLSTVASAEIETIAERSEGRAWFQLYPPRDWQVTADLLDRCKAAAVPVLVITVDVPVGSRRERQRRAGITMPPKMSAKLVRDALLRPAWSYGVLRHGMPRFRTVERYAESPAMTDVVRFVGQGLHAMPNWDWLGRLRDAWKGALVIKGVMRVEDAARAAQIGVDGVWVSNHGGRQFDAGPAAVEVLPNIVEAVGHRTKILFDSGVRSGLDVARALALGADFVLLGRAFLFGAGAIGAKGPAHVAAILKEELDNALVQLGIQSLHELPHCRA